ncbi:MDR family MFS transporter [Streptomyces sp. Ncost-T10-10d]|uniref:MDR family MFS transporter n=1 Tax=Streptomyces sp. Ncost-T10-10d TaxID=1839774 RepID=UPI00081DA9ED|nr:MDR family MFS transporter [Streptomyces sp. Ncost-T10-10d]SCF79679.1 drug resistance transporter, EmrB/QacA subfamily [Streptomyces sp. Ncost-T10-10d]
MTDAGSGRPQGPPTTTAPPLPPRFPLLLAALLLTSAMSMLDQSIVATAGPSLTSDLGALNLYSWTFTAYMLTFSVAMPVYGKLGDLFGRRVVYLSAVVIFLAGSAACGAADSMGQLIAFRALQGLGGGGLQVSAFSVLGDLMPPRQRAKYQGWFAGVMVIANLAGPLAGGFLTDQFGWRWIFYINLPLGLLAMAGIRTLLPRDNRGAARPRIDYGGTALLAGVIVCLVLVTDLAGRYGWGHTAVIALGAGAVLLGALWLRHERRTEEPVVPLTLFADRTFTICVVVAFAVSFAFFGCVNFVPLLFQTVEGVSATRTGLLFLPAMIGMAVATVVAGQVIAKTGRYKWFPVASTGLAAVAAGFMALTSADTGAATVSALLAVMGIGVGLSSQVTTLVAQSTASRQHIGVSTSTVGLARNIGVAFGATVFGSLLNARLATEAVRQLPPDVADRVVGGTWESQQTEALDPQTVAAVADVYSGALSTVFLSAVPVLVLGLILALMLKDVRLEARGPGGPGGPGKPVAAERPGDTRKG